MCERSHLSRKLQLKESVPFLSLWATAETQETASVRRVEPRVHFLPTYTHSDVAEELEGQGKNTWKKWPRTVSAGMPEDSPKEVTSPRRTSLLFSGQ